MSDSYKVGYKKPPAQHRFQKGKSGNPLGRRLQKKKPTKTMLQRWNEEISQEITITEDGRSKRVSKGDVLVKQVVHQAMKGNLRTLIHFAKLFGSIEIVDTAPCEFTFRIGDQVVDHENNRLFPKDDLQPSTKKDDEDA